MKLFHTLTGFFFFLSCIQAKESYYTASTPAAPVIRQFLGISLSDSIDFIRWDLTLTDHRYSIECNYGIGKPNTNGFIDDGKKVSFSGTCKREKNIYTLERFGKKLYILDLNGDLLQLLDAEKRMLVGNGGWSFTMNNIQPSFAGALSIGANSSPVKDSLVFVGRTPCSVPSVPLPAECYKLKWKLALYANGKYRLWGTAWGHEQGITGNWNSTEQNSKTIYRLDHSKGSFYLLKADEHILLFSDASGKLLVGDEDFSYTLNRIE